MDKITALKAELARVQAQIDAMRKLEKCKVSNKTMHKREILETQYRSNHAAT